MNESQAGNDLLQSVLNVIVSVSAPILLYYVGAAVRAMVQRVQMSLSAEQLAFAETLIRQFVKAAEQYNLAKKLERTGLEKKAWAIARAETELKRRGIAIDVDVLSDLVEAAVLDEINRPSIMIDNQEIPYDRSTG